MDKSQLVRDLTIQNKKLIHVQLKALIILFFLPLFPQTRFLTISIMHLNEIRVCFWQRSFTPPWPPIKYVGMEKIEKVPNNTILIFKVKHMFWP